MSDAPLVRFGPDGLVPVVVQDATTHEVLMAAFMNQKALDLTRETGKVHFWSRSRGKLWQKGETSGHEQRVRELRINCNEDSLLVLVDQIGACCHTGHPSCFYRRIEGDGALAMLSERSFDPNIVYGEQNELAVLLRTWFGAYRYLRDHDLSAVSSTSVALRGDGSTLPGRLADELHELAGVLRGEHHHSGLSDDIILEASQALYWLALVAVHAGIPLHELGLIDSLSADSDALPVEDAAAQLDEEAARWLAAGQQASASLTEALQSTALTIHAAVASAHIPIQPVIESDLAELRSRTYLEPYFEGRS